MIFVRTPAQKAEALEREAATLEQALSALRREQAEAQEQLADDVAEGRDTAAATKRLDKSLAGVQGLEARARLFRGRAQKFRAQVEEETKAAQLAEAREEYAAATAAVESAQAALTASLAQANRSLAEGFAAHTRLYPAWLRLTQLGETLSKPGNLDVDACAKAAAREIGTDDTFAVPVNLTARRNR